MRIPRKSKKKIPNGYYCYKFLKIINDEKVENVRLRIKPCIFYQHVDGLEGYCKLLKCDVIDQVKSCYYNEKE